MGSTSPSEKGQEIKKESSYYIQEGVIQNQKSIQTSTVSIPLFLLSLAKINEIKTFIQENQEEIEKNENVKLLKILCDLNKSTKLINDYVNIFNQEFSGKIRNLDGLSLYNFALNQLDSELKSLENIIPNISIMELFYFNINKACGECKKMNPDHLLMMDSRMLNDERPKFALFCQYCNKNTNHIIKINNKPKIIISINKDLENSSESEVNIKNEYETICHIYPKSLVYKSFKNFYEYDLDSNTYKKTEPRNDETIVYIYREIQNNTDSENNLNNQKIMSFFEKKNYVLAIVNYVNLKKNNNLSQGKMFLVNKEYFDYLLMMNDIDSNNFMMLDANTKNNQFEIMNMNNLIIYDRPDKILGDADFVTEEILQNLGFKASEYLGKDVKIIQIVPNKLYHITFHDNSRIKVIIRDNQQTLCLLDKCTIPSFANQNLNNNNNNQQSEIHTRMINNSLNINLNNVSNVNSQEDKKVKELRDKMMLIYTNIAKLFNDIKVTKSLINNHIVNENNYEEYLLMGKSSYNKITKIFELDDVYQNENIVFNDDSLMSKISLLQKNDFEQRYNLFESRKKLLKKENLLILDFGNTKIDEGIITYPKDFILIKQKNLEEFLSKLDIKIKPVNQVYQMILGEGYAFIKDNNREKNIIFIARDDINMVFNLEMIIKFKKDDEFTKEITKHIKNKGFNNYLRERTIDLSKKSQNLINKENDNIGKVEIIINANPLIRSLLHSFSNIEKMNYYFKKLNNNNSNTLSILFSSYIKNNNQDLIQMDKFILQIEQKLKETSNQNLKILNFKELIKWFLNTLDNECF